MSTLTPEQMVKLRLLTVTMIAATSAYKAYAKGDPFKSTRLGDFRAAVQAGKELLAALDNTQAATVD